MEELQDKEDKILSDSQETKGLKGFFQKYGPNIILGIFIIYVILLAIGTFADIFKIQSILDWWIWRTW